MAHIQSKYSGLWKPQNLSIDKVNSQRMFSDNIDILENFALLTLRKSITPVSSLSELRSINTSDINIYADGTTIMVKSNGLYFFDRNNTSGDNDNTIIAPTTGGGRWVSDHIFLGSLAFKDSLTKSDIGLGNVPNVSTNDQTPTFTQATSLTNVSSGEKMSVLFGKIMKGLADLISHLANKSNPHGVTKAQVGLGNIDNTSDASKPISTAQATAIAEARSTGESAQSNLNLHKADTTNPHGVTKTQIGLGNVPNVSTNDQTPTFTQATSLTNVSSGEKMSVLFGKIMKGLADLISHLANKSNPHGVTKEQVGLGNVDNTSDANKPISTAMQTALDDKAPAKFISENTEVNSWNALNSFLDTTLVNMPNNSMKYVAILLTADIGPFYHSGTMHFQIDKINSNNGFVFAMKYGTNPNEARFYSRNKYNGTWGDWISYPTVLNPITPAEVVDYD